MGRKRRSRRGERDVSTPHSITSFAARPRGPSFGVAPLAFRPPVLGDGRHFHPAPNFAPAFTLRGGIASVGLGDRPAITKKLNRSGLYPRPGHSQTRGIRVFSAPESVSVCVRRKRRKEVLHALKKAGRGGPQRKRRRSQWSHVSC